MKDFLNKFKIPTILGLGIIFLGLISGLFLILQKQIFLSRAAPDQEAKNIIFTNQTDSSVVISWQTNTPTASFVTFGQNNPTEQTVLDDRDDNPASSDAGPKPHLIHYVTLKNLLPKTKYQLKIISGKNNSEILQFETSQTLTNQPEFTPVIGSVVNGDTTLDEGIIYLSLPGANTQSSLIKKGGNFLIPISQIAKFDLSDTFSLSEDLSAKLTIQSGQKETLVQFKLKTNLPPLPPLELGQNIDLTTPEQILLSVNDLDKYDLNEDGKINAADNAIILQNFSSLRETDNNPRNKKADLNKDGIIDQKDLDLISQKITNLGSQ